MKHKLRPYGEYKETNIDWIGKVPLGWETTKLSTKFLERRIKVSDKDYIPLSVTKKGVVPQLSTAAKSNDGDNRKLVKKADFVINSRSDRKGSSGLSSYDGSVSLINIVLEPQSIHPEYVHYLFRSNNFVEEYYKNGRGIVADLWTTRFIEMKNIYIPIPLQEEQDQIVKYLDYKLAKINKFITAKKKLIEVLKEQKQAIINQAVTKGLNPDAKMKPSGIEWLGDVPEHWEVKKIKHCSKVNPDTKIVANQLRSEDYVVFLPMEKISVDGEIDCSEKRKYKDVKSGFTAFFKNDVVIAKITPCFENGKGACLRNLETVIGFGTTELIVLRANNKHVVDCYLYYLTKTDYFRLFGEEVMTGSAGQKRIPVNYVANFQLAIPSLEEQRDIAKFISEKLKVITRSIDKIVQELDLIQQYRTSLINSVVTGKVNVQNISIHALRESDYGEY